MSRLETLGNVIETDVLVIGAGVAGLFASVRAKKFVDRVTLVDKGPIGRTSQGYFSCGGYQSLIPEDDIDSVMKEVIYFEDGLCDQELVESIYEETFARMKEFEKYGLEWARGDDANRAYKVGTRGLDYVRRVMPYPMWTGGESQIKVLTKEVKRVGVQLLSRVFITEILKHDGKIVGAVGFNVRDGSFHIFKAGAVIIATGQCSFKGHYAAQGMLTGDGMVMALRAGAELKNLEFLTMWMQPAAYIWENLGLLFPMGAAVVNARGENIHDKILTDPGNKDRLQLCCQGHGDGSKAG